MWWETFYSFGICSGLIGVAYYGSYFTNRLDTGRSFRRDTSSTKRLLMCMRDHKVSGNMYVLNGLETIQDEPDNK